MGDVFRMAREYSFVAPDSVLMHGLWQQSFGSLWIVGRILLTLYRWPLVGGLLVALLLIGLHPRRGMDVMGGVARPQPLLPT